MPIFRIYSLKVAFCLSWPWVFCFGLFAQGAAKSTSSNPDTVTVVGQAFLLQRGHLNAVAMYAEAFQKRPITPTASLVAMFNQVPGVQMEERSPGSYRLNFRGSSLRSPFGVRNVKIYWNGLPFTDPGGNTYLNIFPLQAFSHTEIVTGPGGSLYGAGTGGVLFLHSQPQPNKQFRVQLSVGSFRSVHYFVQANHTHKNVVHQVHVATNFSGGYRQHSSLQRYFLSYTNRVRLSEKSTLHSALLAGNLQYQTPGGLNRSEYESNPAAARPATGNLPSPSQAKAGIYQQNLLLSTRYNGWAAKYWRTEIGLYLAYAAIKNPTIRNYEKRKEPHGGLRFVASRSFRKAQYTQWLHQGFEFQKGYFNQQVFSNNQGHPGFLQTKDLPTLTTIFAFMQSQWTFRNQMSVVAGLSLNRFSTSIHRTLLQTHYQFRKHFRASLMPRVQVQAPLAKNWEIQATLSRGFSPPTLAELLPSNNLINTALQPEQGWNSEITSQFHFFQKQWHWKATLYHFLLRNALVQQRDASGADYFSNAAKVRHWGIENSILGKIECNRHWIKLFEVQAAYSFQPYRYITYQPLGEQYDGNALPGVASQIFNGLVSLHARNHCTLQVQWMHSGRIFLNDANSVAAAAFTNLGIQLAIQCSIKSKLQLEPFVGVDNLLNQRYSLGNDINAIGQRYFNAAPARNFNIGISVGRIK